MVSNYFSRRARRPQISAKRRERGFRQSARSAAMTKRVSWQMNRAHRPDATRDNGRGMIVRTALARFLVGTCAVALSAGVLIEPARAQATYMPLPPPQSPVFNPSSPYTLPQPSYRPISPATRSAVPDYQVTLPPGESAPRPAVRYHRQTATAKTRVVHRRGRAVVRTEPVAYYYAPFGYGYGCAWQRTWDGFWFRTSPCS